MLSITGIQRQNPLGWRKIGGRGLKIVRLINQDHGYSNPHLVYELYEISLADELNKLLNNEIEFS